MSDPQASIAGAVTDWPAFIAENTQILAPLLVPEILLHQATEITPIWEATEARLEELGLPPPFWAFAWAGGQALARYVLDFPETVRGKRVLDFGAGSGLQGIAAKQAGAARVLAVEIDPVSGAAIALNAALNKVEIEVLIKDVVGASHPDFDVILAGDVCYEKAEGERIGAWLRSLARAGAEVLMGDPIRGFLPKEGLERITRYSVKTDKAIEDTDLRNAVVWRVTG